MAIRYYDEALTEKIKSWVKDPDMRVLSPNDSTRLFQMKADTPDVDEFLNFFAWDPSRYYVEKEYGGNR